jgi:hypothetical protein
MSRGQQIVLFIIVLMLLGVTVVLAVTVLNQNQATPTVVPTLAIPATSTAPPALGEGDTPTPFTVPPTWTPQATRTSPPTNTPGPTQTTTPLPTITRTFAPTFTPRPTAAVTPTTVAPTATVGLQNPGFEGITAGSIPGWRWRAEDNFTPGEEYDPDNSFETPLIKQADDPARFITGPTLQIDAVQHLKFKVYVYQTVIVSPTATVRFQVEAGAFSDTGAIQMAAGILPAGGTACESARWGEVVFLDQGGGVQTLIAPEVEAANTGEVTVCMYAEPFYPAISNAAFFDDAELVIEPPE